jgi:anaerobic magnesium-protoporphyrin IX monomethyl ester cyclase
MNALLLKPICKTYYVIQPNLGLGYLASIFLRKGYNVSILDSGKEKLKWDGFVHTIRHKHYDYIGIQAYSFEITAVKKHAELIKKYSPQSTVILGGPHISGDPEGTLRFVSDADFAIAGEAEYGLNQLLANQNNLAELEKIPGLIWRRDGNIIQNKRQAIRNLDDIEYPAWQLMNPNSYPVAPHGIFSKDSRVAPLIVSRGCPFLCNFCAGHAISGREIRYRSIQNVINEINLLHDTFNIREIHIEDDNFTMHKKYVMEFCESMLKNKRKLNFALPNGIRLDSLDKDMLVAMEKTGFYSMAVGIESGSNRILKKMKKNLTTEIIREKINLIKQVSKIHVTGFFLLGFPSETVNDINQTIYFAKTLDIDKASFSFVMPLPGSELWDVYKKNLGQEINWDKFFFYKIVNGFNEIDCKKLINLHRKAFISFYFRLNILIKLLRQIKKFSQLKILVVRIINLIG